MANAIIAYGNLVDGGTLSGGAWVASLPLTNLQNRTIGKVARTSNDALASTQLLFNAGSITNIRTIGLVGHNFSLQAKYRVQVSDTSVFDPPELVSNGTFDVDTTGVSTVNCNASVVDGKLRLTHSGANGLTAGASIVITTVVGKTYRIYYDAFGGTGRAQFRVGTSYNSSTLHLSSIVEAGNEAIGSTLTFVATSTSTVITLRMVNTTNGVYVEFDNISLKEVTDVEYDSGWLDVWPAMYSSLGLPWEADNFWSGTLTERDREGYTWTTVHNMPETLLSQYVKIEIDDINNNAGYIQFGRLFIGDAWQPDVNMSLGAGIGWQSNTEVQEAVSGAEYFAEKRPFRVAKFTTSFMDVEEDFGTVFDLKRRVGLSGEVIFTFDPEDTINALRRQFYGRLRELSLIEYPYPRLTSTPWEIKELI